MTSPTRTDYRGDRPSPFALRLEQRAREQRQRDLAGYRPSMLSRFATFIRQSFGL